MKRFLENYAKHAALNLGQALQGVRYIYSHPEVDPEAPKGTAKHLALSVALRSKRVANDLVFAALPPQWHHTEKELEGMASVPPARWFQYGYCAWKFDDTGEPKANLKGVDPRWDPRCDDAKAKVEVSVGLASTRMRAIKEFYRSCGYTGPTEPDDQVVLATEGKRIVGAVRLVQEKGVFLLRGMNVAKDRQRRGIGVAMLRAFKDLCAERARGVVFLTCGPHLENFYGRIGFKKAGADSAPQFLKDRRDGYASKFGPQIILLRPGSSATSGP